MRRLFWKLFGAFWLTTIVILAVTIFVSFKLADEQSVAGFADPREVDVVLQNILQESGAAGLREYVSDRSNFPQGQTVYLIDQNGEDLLQRRIPERVQNRARRFWSGISRRGPDRRNFDRRSRRLQQSLLETADGTMLLAMPGPTPPPRFGILSDGNSRWTVLALAALISLLVFWWLSRSLARPVARISATAARLASGDLTSRVGTDAYSSDEIGQLAVQFDRMAEDLETQIKNRREMFRNIAHELRAPLTRLQIATELLERKPENAGENLERIRYEIQRVETLTAQVMELARAEQPQATDQTTSLTQVVRLVANDAEFEAGSREVRLRCDIPDEALSLRGNPEAIASAIENVVRNAIQNTPVGGEVVIAVEAGPPCSVTVADTGPGVPDKMLAMIFEPFYRIDTNRPGAGIGLAITSRVLRQLGGTVSASNRPAGGLQVTMRFPSRTSS